MQAKTGVVLLNMGGPEKPADVTPFLYNLFSDRDIIQLGPRFLQKPLAWYIARKRAPKSRATYAKIGGGSPLMKITAQQAEALQEELRHEGDYQVVAAMRYCAPTAADALQELLRANVTTIVALPLYPHFSRATSGSSLADLRRSAAALRIEIPLREIHGWADNPGYVQAVAAAIKEGLESYPAAEGETITVVYSAHSLPTSFIDSGDRYLDDLKLTIAKVEELTGQHGRLCFQSRSGPVEWLSPSTPEMIDRLAAEGCKNILMVPISFVSDHVETLYEINMLYRDMARDRGMRCIASRSLNTDPLFIRSLRDLVITHS